MIGYKAFDSELKCMGFQFEVGKQYTIDSKKEDMRLCSDTVFHFCRDINVIGDVSPYNPATDRVCEIITKGDVIGDGRKYGTNSIYILRELTEEERYEYINHGKHNRGWGNTGDHNYGELNSGDRNFGSRNVGDRNEGNENVGYRNSGDNNVGSYNYGSNNVGHNNEGEGNTGNNNFGDFNTGSWNMGRRHVGFFNTGYGEFKMFNKPVSPDIMHGVRFPSFLSFHQLRWVSEDEITDEETARIDFDYRLIDVRNGMLRYMSYQDAFREAYEQAPIDEHYMLFRLPNFDPDIFREISGIDVSEEYFQWKMLN